MINLILPQTCSVSRAVVDWSSGSPEYDYQTIAKDVPCLYVRRDYETFHADSTQEKARSTGVLYADLECPVQSGDSVVVAGIGTFTVKPEGGVQVNYLGERSHSEWPVAQTS